MKDTSIRVSGYADKIFETYIYHKNRESETKLTKRSLLEAYANRLMSKIPDNLK